MLSLFSFEVVCKISKFLRDFEIRRQMDVDIRSNIGGVQEENDEKWRIMGTRMMCSCRAHHRKPALANPMRPVISRRHRFDMGLAGIHAGVKNLDQ